MEVGGVEQAAKVVEVVGHIDVVSWPLEQQHPPEKAHQ